MLPSLPHHSAILAHNRSISAVLIMSTHTIVYMMCHVLTINLYYFQLCHSSVPCLIIGGSRDGAIHCWQWVDREKRGVEEVNFTLEGHSMGVMGLVSSPGIIFFSFHNLLSSFISAAHSNLLVSGSRDNSVCVWDLQVGCLSDQHEITRNLVRDLM